MDNISIVLQDFSFDQTARKEYCVSKNSCPYLYSEYAMKKK